MDKRINSDESMAASKNFNIILHQIEKSCLNFHLHLTPFSALISLKKTFARDKEGPLHSELESFSFQESEHLLKVQTLEAELSNLREKYEKAVNKYEAACESMGNLQKVIHDRDTAIKNLEAKNQTANALVLKLNTSLAAVTSKFEREKDSIINESSYDYFIIHLCIN